MPVLVPRIRTIGVRLSEEEYSALEKFCVESGARSISDVARTAICNVVSRVNQDYSLASAVSAHSAQVKDLEHRVEQLTAEIAWLKAGKSPDPADELPGVGKEPDEKFLLRDGHHKTADPTKR